MSQTLGTTIKDPQAKVTYTVDWAFYIVARTITSHKWKVNGTVVDLVTFPSGHLIDGLTITAESNTTSVGTVKAEDGAVKSEYRITSVATLSDGDIDERSFTMIIEER